MDKIPYSQKELTQTGEYFKIPGPGTLPKYTFPITPRENYIRAVRDRDPMWIPDYYDQVTLCPACYPDAIARGFVMGPEMVDYMDDAKKGGKDAFDIDWIYEPLVGGSMVKPGSPLLEEISQWKERVHMPDVESWDWAGSKARFAEFLKTETHIKVMWIFTGFFERLISLLDFENAAMALIDDDQKEDVHAFFSACCDAYEKIIRHYKDDFDCDVIYMHDDWGSQRAPLFSAETCMEMIVPYFKRLVDYTHSLGMLFEIHSCGFNELLTDCYLACGVDVWAPQEQNDADKILAQTNGKIMIGIWNNGSSNASDEENLETGRALARKYCADYKKTPVYTCNLWSVEEKFKEGQYVESRKLLCGSEA